MLQVNKSRGFSPREMIVADLNHFIATSFLAVPSSPLCCFQDICQVYFNCSACAAAVTQLPERESHGAKPSPELSFMAPSPRVGTEQGGWDSDHSDTRGESQGVPWHHRYSPVLPSAQLLRNGILNPRQSHHFPKTCSKLYYVRAAALCFFPLFQQAFEN